MVAFWILFMWVLVYDKVQYLARFYFYATLMTSHPRSHLMFDSLLTTASFIGPSRDDKKTAGGPSKVGALGRHLGDETQPIKIFCPPSEETSG